MILQEKVYFTEDFNLFGTRKKNKDWKSLTESLETRYGKGKLNEQLAYFDETPPVPFEDIKAYLLSKDISMQAPFKGKTTAFISTPANA